MAKRLGLTTREAGRSLGLGLQQAGAIARRILRELWRRKRSLMFWVLFPALVLALNGLILAERAQLPLADAFARAAPVSLVGAALFFSCLGGTVATLVGERESGTFRRLGLSPLSGAAYFGGIALAHGAIAVGQGAIVLAIALAMGATFAGSWALGVAICVLSVLAYVAVGFVLGANFARRTEDVNALVAAFGVPLLMLGGSFVPAWLFPPLLQQLARFDPIYHMNEALLRAIGEGATAADIALHLQVLVGMAIAGLLTSWWSYRRLLRHDRQL